MRPHFTRLRLPLLLALTLGAAASTQAATLNVPTTAYPTIQAGINAARPGDTVLIADGAYQGTGNINLDFGGKAITVTSQNGPTATLIDCQNIPGNFGVDFHSGETPASKLQGVTIENVSSSNETLSALTIDGSSPTISNCILANNIAHITRGGGLLIRNNSGVGTTSPLIIGCTFQGNTSLQQGGGAAVTAFCDPSFVNCSFINNTVPHSSSYFESSGSGLDGLGGSDGGGLFFSSNGSGSLTDCTFAGNQADAGGGLYRTGGGSQALVNCTFTGNTADAQGGAITSAIPGSLTLVNCTITANIANGNLPQGIKETIGTGLYCQYSNGVAVTNGILFSDTGGGNNPAQEIANGDKSSPLVTYSDVEGFGGSSHNIGSNPGLDNAPTDLHLRTNSPCLRAGTTQGAPRTDKDGTVRPIPPSMGAFESEPARLTDTADSYVLSSAPAQNFGTAPALVAGGFLGAAYLQFNLSSLAPLAPTSTVKLHLNAGRPRAGTASLVVFATSSNWTETGLTFQNRPAPTLPLGFLNVSANGQNSAPYDVDITAYVQAQQALGTSQVSLALTQFTPGLPVTIDSKENPAGDGPQLVVTY